MMERERNIKPASKPTFALPGTWQKVEVMRRRVEDGEECFHPDDATFEILQHLPPVAIPR